MFGIAMIASVPRWSERVFPQLQPGGWYVLMALIGAMIGWRCVAAIARPDPIRVQRAVGYAVLSLVMLDAAACYVIRGPYLAAAILCLMLPAMYISRKISPT
jgi:hypothetical protein